MADPQGDTITLTISKAGTTHHINLPSTALLTDLISASEDALLRASPLTVYDWDKAKFIAAGTLLRSGPDDTKPIAHLHNKKVTLQVPSVDDIESIKHSSDAAKAREARRAAQRRAAVPARSTRTRRPGEATFGFLRIEPLPGLRNPERSREFLERLADDVGIRAAMRKHGFTVGLLTEMDPLSNTSASHEGTTRLLGLNRNAGEVIELRLRTDAYDGYRAYNTIRATLCHELAHNVHSPHDRQFWDLCHQIEREVAAAASAGRSVGEGGGGRGWVPSGGGGGGGGGEEEEDDVPDHGGWTGGTYVLGAGGSTAGGGGGGGGGAAASGTQGLSRRDVIAKAAEERMRRAREERSTPPAPPDDGGEGGSSAT